MLISKIKKRNQTKSRNLLQMCIFCLLSSFKKGGKIQTGLNCEYDSLSEVILSLSHSRNKKYVKEITRKTIFIAFHVGQCFSWTKLAASGLGSAIFTSLGV